MYGSYTRYSSHLKQVKMDLNFDGQLKPKHFKENKIKSRTWEGHERRYGSKINLP